MKEQGFKKEYDKLSFLYEELNKIFLSRKPSENSKDD